MNTTLLRTFVGFSISFLILLSGCSSPESDTGRYEYSMEITDSPIEISWKLLSNFEPDDKLSASLTFHNTGGETFPAEGWTLYLNSIRELDSESFLPAFNATHINGDFFKLEPTGSFDPIPAGESRTIEYQANYHAIKKTDAPQGFYFAFEDDHIETVKTVSVEPFETEEQINRTPDDNLEIPTAESRFRKNESLRELNPDQVGKITPTPVSVEYGDGVYELADGVTITYAADFSAEADYLSSILNEQFEVENITEPLGGDWDRSGILLNVDAGLEEKEAYRLQISEEAIELAASSKAGIFYAVQSLRSLISNRDSEEFELITVEIEDYPRFEYRGMHLDVARNFQAKESVLQLLDIMGMYKLNKFHFHLTDDEGWRLAIDELPELTEVGGRRGHTETEENFLIPAYGSGPDPTPGESFGSGWYSREEYIEILQFANERHIEVIPEIDVPGHARAAINAMEVRFNRLSEFGQSEDAEMYRLAEPEDESEYRSVQNFDDNVINVCQESTYNFLGLVFDEIVAMHSEADVPLNMIHVGGDEVPHGAWEQSPACELYMEENSIESVSELTTHFFDRLRGMLLERGLKMAGWEEVALVEGENGNEANPEFADSVVPYVWSSIWGSGREEDAYMLANEGYEVVISNASTLYFDMAYNKSWQEPGFYWASLYNTKDVYSFIPLNLYKNAVQDNYGNPIDSDEYEDAVRLTESGRENILGLQGQLWSETVNEPNRWEYMVLPRLLGLAERAWVGNPSWADIENTERMWQERDEAWNEFANRMGQFELDRLDQVFKEINYRLPLPGAIIEDGMLKANSAFPGLDIRYEINGGKPDRSSPIYVGPVEISKESTLNLSIFNSVGRSSRVESIQPASSD